MIARAAARPSFVARHLDPTDSVGELLFGAIMALTFTIGAGLIVEEGEAATTEILLGLLGCNLAWGLIDSGMYVMSCVLERTRKYSLFSSIKAASTEDDALGLIGKELDDRLESITSSAERSRLYRNLLDSISALPPQRARVQREDLYGALAVFWLVSLSAIPAILPFLVLSDRFTALRVSNLLLLILLFRAGFLWARATNSNPWRVGTALLLIGIAMVAIAIPLGG